MVPGHAASSLIGLDRRSQQVSRRTVLVQSDSAVHHYRQSTYGRIDHNALLTRSYSVVAQMMHTCPAGAPVTRADGGGPTPTVARRNDREDLKHSIDYEFMRTDGRSRLRR
jgi:hypothetical protein